MLKIIKKVQPGESIIKLVNPDKLEVGFILPETNVRLTREKMQVAVEFDTYKGKWFKAEVKEFVDASPRREWDTCATGHYRQEL